MQRPLAGKLAAVLAAQGQRRSVGAPLGLEGDADVETRIHQPGLDPVNGTAGPAVAAESRSPLVAKAQAGDLFEHARHLGHHDVVHGGGAHQHPLGAEHLGQDLVLVVARHVVDLHRHPGVHLVDALGDGVGHHAGVVGHGVVEEGDAILLVVVGPLQVFQDDLGGIVAPDDAVGGSHHAHRQVEAQHLLDLGGHQRAEGGEYVGVVALALLHQLNLIHFVVEQVLVAVVLTEGIVGEEHRILRHIGHHAVGPVQHGGLDKHQLLAVADIQAVAGFHRVEIPLWMMMVACDGVDGVVGAVDGGARDAGHQLGQGTGMILLGVVDHDNVDGGEIDLGRQILHELAAELVIDSIDQHILAFADEIAVVAGALVGLVLGAVKVAHLPVPLADPVNVVFDVNGHQVVPQNAIANVQLNGLLQLTCQLITHCFYRKRISGIVI